MSAKKLIAIFLAVYLCVSMCACFGGFSDNAQSYEDEEYQTQPTTTEDTTPQLPAMDMNGVNVIDGKAEFTFVRAYHTTKVEPPNPENKGTSFTANNGEYYLVLHLNVTNTSSESSSVDKLFKVYLYNGDFGSGTMSAVVEPEQHRLDRSHYLQPGESALVYFMVRCPDTTDLTKMTIEIGSETNAYLGEADFSTLFSYKEETPKFAKGNVFNSSYAGNPIAGTPGTTFAVTIADIYMADSLQAPYAAAGSTYWPDQADSQYLIVKLSVKNTGTADLSYWNIASASCTNINKQKYDAFIVAEINDATDLKIASAGMTIAPQEENVIYFAMIVPNTYANTPLEITLYISSDKYICNFPA